MSDQDDLLMRIGAPTCTKCGALIDSNLAGKQTMISVARTLSHTLNIFGVPAKDFELSCALTKISKQDDHCPQCEKEHG